MTSVFICILNIYLVEARVYCTDAKASKWMPLGFSCPINCNNVISAINRLKYLDYKQISLTKNMDVHDSEIVDSIESYFKKNKSEAIQFKIRDMKRKSFLEKLLHKEFNNTNIHDKIIKVQTELRNEFKTFNNGTCSVSNMAEASNMADMEIDKFVHCARRFNADDEFIRLFTKIMNKHFPSYKFTYKTIQMLLDKVLGQGDLRHGEEHVRQVVKYLGQAVNAYNEVRNQTTVLRLKSKHCFFTFVSGCYCKSGCVYDKND